MTMDKYEFREFKPYQHSRDILDGQDVPAWVKRLSRRRKDELHARFAHALYFAMQQYLETIAGNLPVKRRVGGKPTERDLTVLVVQIRRKLDWMRRFSLGHGPLAFTRKNPYYRKGDEKAPLFSEAYLYSLFGKEDGRTIGGRFRELCRLVGLDQE